MTGSMRRLLSQPTLGRSPADYEAMFDDYVAWAGGRRVSDIVAVPHGAQNADYVFEGDSWRLIVELKQVGKYAPERSVQTYFADLYDRVLLRSWEDKGPGQIRVTPESLTTKQWREFYDKAWPQVPEALTTANRQIRSTAALLPPTGKRQLGAAFMVNTGDYNLPTDLLFRFVERKTKKEWKGGSFRSLDFVACMALDLYHPDQHPLHARHIVRSNKDAAIRDVAVWTFDRWVAYANAELGTRTSVNWDATDKPLDLRLGLAFAGKLRLTRADE